MNMKNDIIYSKDRNGKTKEYMILGKAINYNYWLYLNQNRFHKMGIFAPTYTKIKELPAIQLKYFDMNNYRFWEWG